MSRIVNIRGTSGSGKTHIVRRIMNHYLQYQIHTIPGRKQPIGYTYHPQDPMGEAMPLFVVGHYEGGEGGCGGCDNLPQGLDYIYSLIHEHADRGEDVIFEGLIVASDWRRCVDLAQKHDTLIIGLSTPLVDCLTAVQGRRDAKAALKGETAPPLNPKNTDLKHRALITQRKHFKDAGVDFRVLDRDAALNAALEHLGLRTSATTAATPVG